jgi:hypothetical protein
MQKRIYAYLLCGLSVVQIHSASAQTGETCQERVDKLNSYYGAKYIELDAKCYGTDGVNKPGASGVAGSEGGEEQQTTPPTVSTCEVPKLSPECLAQYDALSEEAAMAWNKLFTDCPDLGQPIPIAAGDKPTFRGGAADVAGPSFRAPTKVELLKRVKGLEKRLRRANSERRRALRTCRR